jgi:beta-lactamase class A
MGWNARWWPVAVAAGLSVAGARCAVATGPPDDGAARAYLATIRPAPELQAFLDETIAELLSRDGSLRSAALRVALIDLSEPGPPQMAHYHGNAPVYPASVVKFVYLMAAYAWQEQGKLRIDDELDQLLVQMVYHSSNQATQQVVARLTGTTPGPELSPQAYRTFKRQRLLVKDWLATLGITGLHCVHPTYDGGADLYGRDVQFLKDPALDGALPSAPGSYPNRQAMTAIGTAELLALLATDRALSAESSAAVRGRMLRDPTRQPYLARRIAGGAARLPDLEVYSKSGTWGPIFADAGIVRRRSGAQLALAVFVDASPAYRGDAIAEITQRSARRLLYDQDLPERLSR